MVHRDTLPVTILYMGSLSAPVSFFKLLPVIIPPNKPFARKYLPHGSAFDSLLFLLLLCVSLEMSFKVIKTEP